MRPRAMRRAAAALVVLLVGGVAGASTSTSAPRPSPVRILLVGDSVTQGSVGDWTWRYRLWQHFESNGAAVDFVGPNHGVFDGATGNLDDPRYADPAFDSDHAAHWGMALQEQDYPIGDLVRTFHPDVVVEMLGINDFLWKGASPDGVAGMLSSFVTDVQAADPDTDVVLGSLPQTWQRGVPELDDELPNLASELTTPGSTVVVASPDTPYVEDTDTWDPVHPSATGEMKIAAGMADALALLGIGDPVTRPLPVVANGPVEPPVLERAAPGNHEVQLTWSLPPGATSAYVWLRDATAGEAWRRLPVPLEQTTWTSGGLDNFDDWEFRIQARKGSVTADDVYSDVLTARPAPAQMGRVTITPVDHGLALLWPVVAGATGYHVSWWPLDQVDAVTATDVTATSTTVGGLVAGQQYGVSVTPVWDDRSGTPATATGTAGGTRPAAVQGVTAAAGHRDRVRLTWAPPPAGETVTEYEVQQRVDGTWTSIGRSLRPFYRTDPQPAGPQRFRVRAWTELLPGPWSATARVRLS